MKCSLIFLRRKCGALLPELQEYKAFWSIPNESACGQV